MLFFLCPFKGFLPHITSMDFVAIFAQIKRSRDSLGSATVWCLEIVPKHILPNVRLMVIYHGTIRKKSATDTNPRTSPCDSKTRGPKT